MLDYANTHETTETNVHTKLHEDSCPSLTNDDYSKNRPKCSATSKTYRKKKVANASCARTRPQFIEWSLRLANFCRHNKKKSTNKNKITMMELQKLT